MKIKGRERPEDFMASVTATAVAFGVVLKVIGRSTQVAEFAALG